MIDLFSKIIIFLSRHIGIPFFILVSWIIATGFFLFFPFRLSISVKFYRVLFPKKSAWFHMLCAWKQYHNFTSVFLDRFLLDEYGDISYTFEGWKYLEEAIKKKSGGIILMSHMGNWEMAAHFLKRKDIRLLLYMGIKEREQLEASQKENLRQRGVKIIGVDHNGGSPFDIVESMNFIKKGGYVALAGDRIWNTKQRKVKARFLGHEVHLPEGPHLFALLSGAPIFIFFSFRKKRKKYHFIISKPIFIKCSSRAQRKAKIHACVQIYVSELENRLYENPFEWYHFEKFLK